MTHQLYRDHDLEGYEDLVLDLDQDLVDYLEAIAKEKKITVDEVIEDTLRSFLDANK